MLGKRPRPPIRRTTSMTGIEVDLINVEGPVPSDPQNPMIMTDQGMFGGPEGPARQSAVVGGSGFDHGLMATVVSPRYLRRSPGDHIETAHFLRKCGLCKRRLAPGRDIYMYRGDAAFCSLECREQQMKQDERKEKCSVAVSKKDEHHHSHSPPTATSEA
ncbi:hypothetical protein F0562_003273 [Nyssa sinensis]|uniref:FLZ-type domain-containing protein n=1 Tax=Nyssa sinensis TaxID=561372 RepID=A0A5J5BW27_9ASTE|nr:hypothetical protein F0562_003273 [Nyssa sinensis]